MLARLQGWKTLAVFLAVSALGVLDALGTIDLKALLILLGVPEERIGGVVAAIGAVGLVLRVMTTTPVGQAAPPADGEPR